MSNRTVFKSGLTFGAGRALLPLMVLATACIHFGRLPARELYRITLPEVAAADSTAGTSAGSTTAPALLSGTIGIAEYATPGVYGDPLIVYRIDDTQYGSYPSREWAVPLSDQLGVLTERVLKRVPLTAQRAVFDPPSRRAQTYIWRGTVREFEEVGVAEPLTLGLEPGGRVAQLARQDDGVLELPLVFGQIRLGRGLENDHVADDRPFPQPR